MQQIIEIRYEGRLLMHMRMKVPLEALHSLALQQIGEQESYIEELGVDLLDPL